MPDIIGEKILEILGLSSSKEDQDLFSTITTLLINYTPIQNQKFFKNELIYKTETDSQTQRMNLWLTGGKGGATDSQGVWD